MSPEIKEALFELRRFMFDHLYKNQAAKSDEVKAENMLKQLYAYYVDHPEKMSEEYRLLIDKQGEEKEKVVCDYISGMTDQYSKARYCEIYIPCSWSQY